MTALAAASVALLSTNSQAASSGCSVTYAVTSQWSGGFVANVSVTNLGSAVNGWTLAWTFPDSAQKVSSAWNATLTQSGANVSAASMAYNAALASGASTSFGFQGTSGAANPVPTAFSLNGVACTGSATSTPTPTATSATPTPTATSASPTPTPTGTTPAPSPSGVHGYATVNGSTTGGGGGSTVTVTTLASLITAAGASATSTVRVSGNFSCSADVTVASNKTIIGVGSGSGLTGCGLRLKGISNVIVRNLMISKVLAGNGNGDSIHIESSDHIWVDHNDLSSDTSHGTDYYDGQLDITHAADYITVSYNYIHDHIKCSLIGHSDSNAAEDTGHLHVTYDHNYFYNCDQRMPSIRFGTLHAYNNYYVNGSTGIHTRMGAQALVQNNVWVNVGTPIETTKDSSVDGFVNQSGNNFGTGTNLITQIGTFTQAPYGYTLDPTSSVPSSVPAGAGTGKVSG